MEKLEKIKQKLDLEDYQGLIALKNENIKLLTGFTPASFGALILGTEPLLLVSAMDMELAKQKSKIPVKTFESLKQIEEIIPTGSRIAVEESLTISSLEKLNKNYIPSSSNILLEERMIKKPEEIKKIEQATHIAQKAFKELEITDNEWKVAYQLGYLMREYGAKKESFDTIVAYGTNSSLPHAEPTNKEPEYPILIDWGAYHNNYCSDNTRTIIQTEKQEEIYNIVEEAYQKALKTVKPGIPASDIDKAARDIITEYGYGENFIHSTGHGVGLEIHELPNISTKSNTLLEKNMVITIEPGIYLEGEFGVRIEDTIQVTNKGKIIGNLPHKI